MKNKIVISALIITVFSVGLFADFDNFTNWGDIPVATEQSPQNISKETLASFTGFEAGRKNGAPTSPSSPLINGEFHTLESDNDVVIVSVPVEFPQKLKPTQTIKINLGSSPLAVGVTLKFALISEKLKRNDFMTYRFERAERPILIRFNGKILYHRNITDGWAEQEIFIPHFFFNDNGNSLEITNEGNLTIAFDYLRVQLATEGQKVFGAFAPNNNLPKYLTQQSKIEFVELSLPTEELENAPFLGNAQAPLDYSAAYSAMGEFFSLGYTKDKKYGEVFNNWAAELSKILKKKKLPYVHLKGDLSKVNDKTTMWFLTRYGYIVGGWICDDERSADILSKYINGVNIVSIDVRDTQRVKTAANAPNTYPRTYLAPVSTKGGRQDRAYGDFMQHYLSVGKNFNPTLIPYFTPQNPLVNQQAIIDNGEDTLTALLQVFMHGGRGVLIDAGDAGKNVLLQGKQQPIWQLYNKAFKLVEGDGILLPMALSLEKHVVRSPLEDCYYVASKNNDNEVTVVVLAGRGDSGREVRAIVPVPWSGAATVTQQNFYIDEIGQSVPTPSSPTTKKINVFAPPKVKGTDIGPLKGVVSYKFETSGFTIIKLERFKSKKSATEKASKVGSKDATLAKAKMFNSLPYKWRYSPLVASTNQSDLVAFATNKISVVGQKGIGKISVSPSKNSQLNCFSAPESFDTNGKKFVMRGDVPIWDDNSIFLMFSGAKRKQRPSYIFNFGIDDYLKGAEGFVFFAQAKPIVNSLSEQLTISKNPVTFAIGSRSKQLLFDVKVDEPNLVFVPYSEILGLMNDPSMIYLAMDSKEQRDIALELNYICAIYENPGEEPKLAVRYDLYEKALYLLVEGDTGKPLNVTFRMKDKFNLGKATPILPHGFTNLKLDVDVERNKYGINIEKLPNNDGKKGDVSKYFPAITGEAPSGRTRVLIKFAAERF